MKRGEIWTVAGGSGYAGKPRPVVIVRDDRYASIDSVTFVPLTSNMSEAWDVWPIIQPDAANGLMLPSRAMVDKITSVSASKIGRQLGQIDDANMLNLSAALLVYLGMAVTSE